MRLRINSLIPNESKTPVIVSNFEEDLILPKSSISEPIISQQYKLLLEQTTNIVDLIN